MSRIIPPKQGYISYYNTPDRHLMDEKFAKAETARVVVPLARQLSTRPSILK